MYGIYAKKLRKILGIKSKELAEVFCYSEGMMSVLENDSKLHDGTRANLVRREIYDYLRDICVSTGPYIIAVDFDDTLSLGGNYPGYGDPNMELINALKMLQEKYGVKIILWTNREGDVLTETVAWCEQYGLHFDAVNDNLDSVKKWMGANTRKIFANVYIDDRNLNVWDYDYIEDLLAKNPYY